jgi:hypothetical protein
MIARSWRAVATAEGADRYGEHFRGAVLLRYDETVQHYEADGFS